MPRITTTTTTTTDDGGGGLATLIVLILGAFVLAPVIGVYVAALTSLLTTLVLCIVVLAFTGGALYWLREHTRERRIRLEHDLALAQYQVGVRPLHQITQVHHPDQIPPAKLREIEQSLRVRPGQVQIRRTTRKELE